MEIKAKRGALLATLYWTQSIVERRNTMPILANVMIEAQKSGIRITATDLEVGVRGSVEGEVVREGTVTVSAKKALRNCQRSAERSSPIKTPG